MDIVMPGAWRCELHHLWTTGDCPDCDDEQIADLERYAKTPACHQCMRTLTVGEAAWASDWVVIEPGGARHETRYTCGDCDVFA